MFFRDTLVPVTYYEYKWLMEIVCSTRGYHFTTTESGVPRARPIHGPEGEACRFVYQTLRVLPISKLYFETGIESGGSNRIMLEAIARLYTHDSPSLQGLALKYNLPIDSNDWDWAYASRYVDLLEGGLMQILLKDVDTLLPRTFDGESALTLYAKTPKLRQGLLARYKRWNPQGVKENPRILDYLESDFADWCGTINIDPDRVDAYVAESVIGAYMGRYFFPHWDSKYLKLYTQGKQRVMYEGALLDTADTLTIEIKEDPTIDFQATMADMLELSTIMFRHSTAKAKSAKYIDLQYSVLEWYIDTYFKSALSTLNVLYMQVFENKYKNLDRIADVRKIPNILRLSTDYKVNRVPTATVDTTLSSRIENNKRFLSVIYDLYPEIDVSSITRHINRHAVRYQAGLTRSKTDSNYPFFKVGTDIVSCDSIEPQGTEMQLLLAMFPDLEVDPTTESIQSADLNNLLNQKQGYIVTDEGYRKFSLLIRTLKELDDLNEFLVNHGMSIADLNSVNYLTNEYYSIISDLDGVLYDRLSHTWKAEHPSGSGIIDPYTDGYVAVDVRLNSNAVKLNSNAEVKEFLSSRQTDFSPSTVNLQEIGAIHVTKPPAVVETTKTIQLLKTTKPPFLDNELLWNRALIRMNIRYHNELLLDNHVTKFNIYSERSEFPKCMWDETVNFMSKFSEDGLFHMLGDLVTMLDLIDCMSGVNSEEHTAFIAAIDMVSPTLRYNIASLLDALRSKNARPIMFTTEDRHGDFIMQMGRMVAKLEFSNPTSEPFTFAFADYHFRGDTVIHQGMPIGLIGFRKQVDKLRMLYATKTGFDTRIVQQEESFGETALSLTMLCVAYFKTLHSLNTRYLLKFLPVDTEQMQAACAHTNPYWRLKDLILAKNLSLALINRIYTQYVTKINDSLSVYNREHANPNGKYKVYATFGIVNTLGVTQDLKRLLSSINQVFQDLKAGVPEQEYLAQMDNLHIDYAKNSMTSLRFDEAYNRLLYHVLLASVSEWFQSTQMLLDVNRVCDEILQAKMDLRKQLHLEKSTLKGLNLDSQSKLIESRLRQIISKPHSELAAKFRALTISSANDMEAHRRIQKICGIPLSMVSRDATGFLKNPDGKYYSCKWGDDSLAFIKDNGIVLVCKLSVDNTEDIKDSVELFFITNLSDSLDWS